MTTSERIGMIIEHKGLSKTKFAEELHVSSQFISSICSGKKQPSDRTIADICRVFGVSELWLRSGEGEMFVQRSFNEELLLMINELLAEKNDSFRKQFFAALLKIPPEQWPAIQRFCESLSGEKGEDD